MTDMFLADEGSVQDSLPLELFEFTLGAVVYRITSGTEDIVHDGEVWRVEAIARGPLQLVELGGEHGEHALTIALRIDHPIVKRWLKQGVPPKTATVTVYRKQVRSGIAERLWGGSIASIDCEDSEGTASVTVASMFGPPFRRRLPTITVGRQCSHVLYGAGCNLSRAGSGVDALPFKCTATATYVNGREVRFNLSTVPAGHAMRGDWLVFGELVHVASGERMTIADQDDVSPGISTVTLVTMQTQIVGLKAGDTIEAYAGCAHDVGTCHQKFANQVNYGGFPALPTRNPFFPTGLGVMEQT